jgi:putative transposase
MERIPASERTREKLKALMEGRSEVEDGRSELVRLAARLIIEEALEGEARDVLGRGYYARGAAPGAGYRNGYRTGRVRSAEGAIDYSAPQIADRSEPFRSHVREAVRGGTEELEALAVEMYARGLSTRDIEALFADRDGHSLLSRTAVSEITERLWAEYEAFATRDLAEFEITYLFVDGIAERLHLGQPREAVLAAWGILADGKKALLHLAPGTKEDTASCKEFFHDMRRRGLPDPLLVASDGAPGLIRAIEECLPRSVRQRCSSAFSLGIVVPEKGFRLTGVEPRRLQRTADSGRVNTRLVCPECGSWVCGMPRDGVVRVRGGTLDDTSWLRPTRHIWTRRKQPWIVLPEGDEVFEGQPA